MGTPRFAEVVLKAIIEAGYTITAVFTQPDKKVGRKQENQKTPVKILAEKRNITVFEPENLNSRKIVNTVAKLHPDLIIVAAYGKILPKTILEIPKYGAINIHASLLPKFRGASPIQGAILAGERETGITLMLMNEKLDAGEIIAQKKIKISKEDNVQTLTDKLSKIGGKLLVKTLPDWIRGRIKAVPQNEKEASYCRTIKKENGKIDWRESAETIYRKWKAYVYWPGIFTFLYDKGIQKQLKLIEIGKMPRANSDEKVGKVVEYKKQIAVQTGKGLVILKKIQLEGKKPTDAFSFSRGKKNFIGSCFI